MIINVVIATLFLLFALILSGFLYEFAASQRAKTQYKTPPGKLIDVGGYQLHMHVMGERHANQPVVVLEASVGSNLLDWQLVQPLIADFAQVISYDRAGNGWSESASTVRTPENLADDLHKLLNHAEIVPPYILVGHRYGGMYVRIYLEKYPDDVAGLVLVDSSHPDVFDEDNTAEIKRLERQTRYFQPLGLVRYVTRRNLRVKLLDEREQAQYIAMMMHDNANLLAEATPILTDGIELPDSVDVPLTVVSRGEDIDLEREREWADRQRQLADLSAEAKHIFAKSTKSWIVFAEPQTIADAVEAMLKAISEE